MFLNYFLVTVSSSELSAFEHRKLWCLQTLCWLHGERSLPIGLLVLFVMTPDAQTIGNIAVYGSAKHLGILFMVLTANPTQFWIFAVTGAFF